MAKLTEDIGKELLQQMGIKIPQGIVALTPSDAKEYAQKIGKKVVIKALVPIGKRGKANAIRFADTPDEAEKHTYDLLGAEIYGYKVRKVLVEECIDIKEEYYLSFTFGDAERGPVVLASKEGGVDIEEITARFPEKLIKYPVNYLKGLPVYEAMAIWEQAGLTGQTLVRTAQITSHLYNFFKKHDALMAEFNPLVLTTGGEVMPIAVMLNIDDAALRRHPFLKDKVEYGIERLWRPLTSREKAVIEADLAEPGKGSIRYIELEGGEIGLCVAGGGAGLLQHDLILKYGGKPANHTDITPGPIENKLTVLFRAILTKPGVKSLLVGVNVLQLVRVDTYAAALVNVLKELKIDPRTFPVVVRLAGVAEEEGKKILATLPGIHYFSDDTTLEEVVKLIVKLTEDAKAGETTREHIN